MGVGGTLDDFNARGGGDRCHVHAFIRYSAKTAEIGVAQRPADIEAARDAEEVVRKCSRGHGDKVVDGSDAVTVQHFTFDHRNGTRRFQN